MNTWFLQKFGRISVFGVVGLLLIFISFSSGSSVQAAGSISLGNATTFGILSGAGTANAGSSVLVGDLGNYPNGSYTWRKRFIFVV